MVVSSMLVEDSPPNIHSSLLLHPQLEHGIRFLSPDFDRTAPQLQYFVFVLYPLSSSEDGHVGVLHIGLLTAVRVDSPSLSHFVAQIDSQIGVE
jgi:hypothetical protein